MFDSLVLVLAVGAAWVAIGLILSIVMGRRGHSSFGWLVLGTMLGPLAVVLAIDARRHDEGLDPARVQPGQSGTASGGFVDVLAGYDGSPESVAAIDTVLSLFGDRLGRFTVATVVAYGEVQNAERAAKEKLNGLTERAWKRAPELEILHGAPAAALSRFAVEDAYDVIAIGSRGAGISKSILGSAASDLARGTTVPVLVVGSKR
jgi:nucleotide-binding universal stress UspA family protein